MPSKRPLTRLRDIADNIRRIASYTEDYDFARFVANLMTRDAAERCLSRISEAGTRLGTLAEEILPAHDWRGIRDIGNMLRHQYEGVNLDTIWAILTQKLPPLLADVTVILARYPSDDEDMTHPL